MTRGMKNKSRKLRRKSVEALRRKQAQLNALLAHPWLFGHKVARELKVLARLAHSGARLPAGVLRKIAPRTA
jgi:hypothetical protein